MAELCEQELTVENEAAEASKPAFLLGYYNYTVVLTYIGMFVGFSGVLLAAKNKSISGILHCVRPVACHHYPVYV